MKKHIYLSFVVLLFISINHALASPVQDDWRSQFDIQGELIDLTYIPSNYIFLGQEDKLEHEITFNDLRFRIDQSNGAGIYEFIIPNVSSVSETELNDLFSLGITLYFSSSTSFAPIRANVRIIIAYEAITFPIPDVQGQIDILGSGVVCVFDCNGDQTVIANSKNYLISILTTRLDPLPSVSGDESSLIPNLIISIAFGGAAMIFSYIAYKKKKSRSKQPSKNRFHSKRLRSTKKPK